MDVSLLCTKYYMKKGSIKKSENKIFNIIQTQVNLLLWKGYTCNI